MGSGTRGQRLRLDRLRRRVGWADVAVFLWIWACVGYSLGTSVLLGPVMWTTARMRSAGWGELGERFVVVAIIGAFVTVSFAASLGLARVSRRSPALHARLGVILLATAAAAGAVWLWMTPSQLPIQSGAESAVGARFTFGPYPSTERLVALREDGYTGVVSLLHPAVVPFEPKLLADERSAAEAAGIEMIHLPMLPWVGENAESLDRLEQMARSEEGRYYVHCYLGRDRVRMARAVVERFVSQGMIEHAAEIPPALELEGGARFERGEVVALGGDAYLIPYPTDEELMAWIVPARPAAVVSLLDPKKVDDRPWMDKERAALARFGIELINIPLDSDRLDPEAVLAAVNEARGLPRPLLVHAFLAPSTGRSPVAETFLETWRSGLPSVPPSKFREGLARGPVRVVAPNVVVGPRPRGPEFWRLRCAGIRAVLFLGDGDTSKARADRSAAAEAPLTWEAAGGDEVLERLERGGPWYVYGPGAESFAERAAMTVHTRRAPQASGAQRLAVARALPTPRELVLLAPLLLYAVALAAWLAGRVRVGGTVLAAYARTIFLLVSVGGIVAPLVAGRLPLAVLIAGIFAVVVVYGLWRGTGFSFYQALVHPSHEARRGDSG